jgi:hypothetical protein
MRARLELPVGNTPAHLPPLWVEVGWLGSLVRQAYTWFDAPDNGG